MVTAGNELATDRVVFVHVPKTSGTTINAYLHECSPFGIAHLELYAADPSRIDIRTADWVSAHMAPSHLSMFLERDNRDNRWFSIVRNPLERLISQVNFALDTIARGPDNFALFDQNSIPFILDAGSVDFTNPFSVITLLLKRNADLESVMGRHLLFVSSWQADYVPTDRELRDHIGRYAFIAHEETRDQLLAAFGFCEPPENINARFNVSSYHFDPKIFQHPMVKPYVDRLLEQDYRIYDMVREMFPGPATNIAMRPSYPVATAENFSEENYRAANPDVRDAVEKGVISSAREHFEHHGRGEGRRILAAGTRSGGWRMEEWREM
jgi:hypothetical protein